MSIFFRPMVPVLVSLLSFICLTASAQQENKKNRETDKDQKIRDLERRLDRLEKIVLATSQLSVLEAERQLTRMQQQFEHSERLFIRGLINEAQFSQDRFELQLAKRELLLAKNTKHARKISMEIDFMRAKNRLRVAKENFDRSKRFSIRGLSSPQEVEINRRQIGIAEKALEVARLRLEAISKPIDELKPEAKKQAPKK